MNMLESYTESTPADKGKANLSIALDLAAAGIPVFPCRPDKTPLVRWRDVATTDPTTIRAWWKRHPSAAPGIPTGKASGLAVLDLDRKGGKDGVAAIRAKGFDPDRFPGPVVETPSGGLHLICRHRDGLTNAAGHLPDGADVRAEGGYIIAPGAWTAAGRYKPRRGDLETDRLLGLPAWPKGLEPPPCDRVEAAPPPADVDLATVKDALRHIPNDGSHDDWTRTLMAVHHATGGSAEGLAIAYGWSAGYAGFSFREVKAKWSSFRRADGDLVTAASLFKLARQHGWSGPDDALADLDDLPEDDDPDAEIARLLGLEAPARPAGMWMTPRDCANAPRAPYVIKGLIAEGQVAAIVGAPGAGKSILAPALAYAVAQGREAFGRRTRQGGVFYVAAEDQMGMAARITALRQEHGEADDLKLGSLHNLFPGSDDLKRLRKEVSRYRPKLVVIDTLAMAFPGLKENEAEAMNSVVQAAKALTRWGAAVVLIHHDTKAGTDGLPRGHSVLNGALDVSLYLTRDGGTVTARPTKNRNGTCDQALAFDIGSRVIGKDEDGDDLTAPIAEPASPDATRRGPKMTPTEQAVLGIFDDLGGGKPVDRDVLREAAMSDLKVSASENRASRKDTFNRALRELVRKGVLETLELQGCGMVARHRITPDPAEEFDDISIGEDAP